MQPCGLRSNGPPTAPAPPFELEPSARELVPDQKVGESLKDPPTASDEAVVPVQESAAAREVAPPSLERVSTQKQERQQAQWTRGGKFGQQLVMTQASSSDIGKHAADGGALGSFSAVASSVVSSGPSALAASSSSRATGTATKKARRAAENLAAPGGMRSPHLYVSANPRAALAGTAVTNVLTDFIVANPLVVSWLIDEGEVGRRKISHAMEADMIKAVGKVLGTSDLAKGPRSRWRAGIVEAYIQQAEDPEKHLPTWLREGVPTGVQHEIPPSGIFPQMDTQAEATSELWRHFATGAARANYKSAEENRQAFSKEVERLITAGFVTKYATYEDLKRQFNDVIISKVAALIKDRDDGTQKVRIIIDMLRSRVNAFVRLSERIVLPRLMDIVTDLLALTDEAYWAAGQDGETIDIMVADFQDAFHTLGVLKEERPYQVFKLPCGGYGVYETAVFGGGGSPLTWGRAAAFVGRSSQSLFCPTRARIEIYVDDPLTVWRGTREQIRVMKTVLLLWWITLGLEVSWAKVQHGRKVKWIGAMVEVGKGKAKLALPQSYAEELHEEAKDLLKESVTSVQRLRRLAGKASWAGGFIPAVGAMIAPLWAAAAAVSLTEGTNSGSANESGRLVPVIRAKHALHWIVAWTGGISGTLQREFVCAVHFRRPRVRMDFDASPWGYGGVLFWEGKPWEYFAIPVSEEDKARFGIVVGDHRFQTLLENLAMLIGVRQWLPRWRNQRAIVTARTDSASAVGAWTKERSKSAAVNAVVREAALDMAEGLYRVDTAEHVPGVSNVLPDALSRLYQPGQSRIPPVELLSRQRVWPEPRVETWWRARDGAWEGSDASSPAA